METELDIIDETIEVNCVCGAMIITTVTQLEDTMITCPKCEKEHVLLLTIK